MHGGNIHIAVLASERIRVSRPTAPIDEWFTVSKTGRFLKAIISPGGALVVAEVNDNANEILHKAYAPGTWLEVMPEVE